jgi:hypothetical protein
MQVINHFSVPVVSEEVYTIVHEGHRYSYKEQLDRNGYMIGAPQLTNKEGNVINDKDILEQVFVEIQEFLDGRF